MRATPIGGGYLEWKAIKTARQVLKDDMHMQRMRWLERFALGPSLGQCCGGAVVLAFERLNVGDLNWVTSLAKRTAQGLSTVRSVSFAPRDFQVVLFGAALIRVLATLPCHVVTSGSIRATPPFPRRSTCRTT